jgi:hypothetical protein
MAGLWLLLVVHSSADRSIARYASAARCGATVEPNCVSVATGTVGHLSGHNGFVVTLANGQSFDEAEASNQGVASTCIVTGQMIVVELWEGQLTMVDCPRGRVQTFRAPAAASSTSLSGGLGLVGMGPLWLTLGLVDRRQRSTHRAPVDSSKAILLMGRVSGILRTRRFRMSGLVSVTRRGIGLADRHFPWDEASITVRKGLYIDRLVINLNGQHGAIVPWHEYFDGARYAARLQGVVPPSVRISEVDVAKRTLILTGAVVAIYFALLLMVATHPSI